MPDSTLGGGKREVVLHVLFLGGGDQTPSDIFSTYEGGEGHFGIKAVGIEDALQKTLSFIKEAENTFVVTDFELITHGTAWRKNARGEVVIDPPCMWVGNHWATYGELQGLKIRRELQDSLRHVRTFLITACNIGHFSHEYLNFRTRLAQLLFCPSQTNDNVVIEVRSGDVYIGHYRQAKRDKPINDTTAETVPERSPPYGKRKWSGIMVEYFYKDTGGLIVDWDKSDILPTIHHSLHW
jgi:hypothetical protein